MSGNFAIKGGGVGPLMVNAILNFHFDFLHPSLIGMIHNTDVITTQYTIHIFLSHMVSKKVSKMACNGCYDIKLRFLCYPPRIFLIL